ncbi:rhodanese-like domain-containing protein [Desulfobacterota bacterium AH_259_B03_O07]|nr:rhodanese-like domain-containing protein [Desulfobacterota bacterium AH_259_B03_O07]
MNLRKPYIFSLLTLFILFILHGINVQSDELQPENQIQTIKNITPQEANLLIQENKDNANIVILDVRTPEEYSEEHIENAVNINFYSETFKEELNNLDKNKIYIAHCRSGGRSSKTLDLMKELGFKEAYNMGGIIQWKKGGFPTTK